MFVQSRANVLKVFSQMAKRLIKALQRSISSDSTLIAECVGIGPLIPLHGPLPFRNYRHPFFHRNRGKPAEYIAE
jgi:hypothetical protein